MGKLSMKTMFGMGKYACVNRMHAAFSLSIVCGEFYLINRFFPDEQKICDKIFNKETSCGDDHRQARSFSIQFCFQQSIINKENVA